MSEGTKVAPNQQVNIRFSMKRGMIIMTQVFLQRVRESFQQLEGRVC
jgi:hypothetical protein